MTFTSHTVPTYPEKSDDLQVMTRVGGSAFQRICQTHASVFPPGECSDGSDGVPGLAKYTTVHLVRRFDVSTTQKATTPTLPRHATAGKRG